MQVSINSKFCESPTNSVPQTVCAIQPAFLIPFNISLQTHNFIFGSISCCSKYNECTCTIYETGEWTKEFTEVTMIALKKKTQATKCSDHRTINLIAYTARIITKILRRKIERKIEDVLGEDQFGLRRGKGTRDAIGMMRIIAEQTLEIDEELCICFIDWQKAFDRVNRTKLMQILKISGIDWRERRLISKL